MQPLAPDTTIQQVYHQANQELLILGDPGAGKSTLLYQLGRDLLAQQPGQPLPVVFPLSSWAQKRLPLQEWMVEQLCSSLYEIPRWQSQQWVQRQQIFPLLDGLDEMEEAARPACIATINAFRIAFPLCPLVVCSRSQEYHAASQNERLHLYNAVEVQPLIAEQEEQALQQAGTTAEELRVELANNAELRELARTPLWLNLLLVMAREASLPTLPQERFALQQEVLRRYIQHMCERKGDLARYSLKQTIHWLRFLANQMDQRNQVVFAIEELQPDWLAERSQRAYLWSVWPVLGLILVLALGLVLVAVLGLVRGWGIVLSLVLVGGLLSGLVGGRAYALRFYMTYEIALAERLVWSWENLVGGIFFGLLIGLPAGLSFGLLIGLPAGLSFGLLTGLGFGLLAGLVSGIEKKQVVERDASSPGEGAHRSMRNGLVGGLVGGLSFGLIGGLFFGLIGGLLIGLLGGLGCGLLLAQDAGLVSAFQHLMIRFWLSRTNCLPWQVIAFLNDACERALLKRVGGTYRFIHRLVLDYFADLSPETTLSGAETLAPAPMQCEPDIGRDLKEYDCSFCGKSQESVENLIKGPGGVYICNECVARIATESNETHDAIAERCCFCGETPSQNRYIKRGTGRVTICNECIALCQEILAEELRTRG